MVKVLKTGLFETIQDLGRFGFQDYGVPYSGVMDRYSAILSNSILGNSSNDAVIECVAFGPSLEFHINTSICITGADMKANINSLPIRCNTAIAVKKGDVLTLGNATYGCRSYIAVCGGFLTDSVMSSRSMYPNITPKAKLYKGDILPVTSSKQQKTTSFSSIKTNVNHFEVQVIEVFEGPEFNQLSLELQRTLFHQEFTVSKDSNRMAYQFNEKINNPLEGLLTSLVLPGTVQLTPSGELMILMRDCQTTGGYPRILQVSENSINILSQKIFGAKIRFKCIK